MKNLDKKFDSKALHDTFSTVGHILFYEMATVGSGQSKVTQSHVNAGLISEPTMVLRDLRETQCGAISSCNNSSFSNHQTRQILEYKKEENNMGITTIQVSVFLLEFKERMRTTELARNNHCRLLILIINQKRELHNAAIFIFYQGHCVPDMKTWEDYEGHKQLNSEVVFSDTQPNSGTVMHEAQSNNALKTLWSAMKLLNVESRSILVESSRCLVAIFLSIKENREVAANARDALFSLVALASFSVLEIAELATCFMANLLLARAISRLLHFREVDCVVNDCVNRAGTVLALVSSLDSSINESVSTSEALEALAILSRSEETDANVKLACAILAEFPQNIIPIVLCIINSTPSLQGKTIEILSRLCKDLPL
ncbi:hypothetical protein KIW84_075287 [Lathyrus oleraceus]|uniref:Uncharacterized protein n=1 Tax=Pisum sativum TaxID=3888 RepID=A0A9D4VTJ8_PEA|nr:hypothetical protein KIW84_075287 [Pisum sativum]